MPSLSGKTTKIVFQWKNEHPVANDPTAVWSNYAGVWHLGDDSDRSFADSSGHELTATTSVSTDPTVNCHPNPAVIGNGRWQKAKTLVVPSYDDQKVGSTFTASGWYYIENAPTYDAFFDRKEDWNVGEGWRSNMQNGNRQVFVAAGKTAFNSTCYFSQSVQGRWIYYALVYTPTTLTVYENGMRLNINNADSLNISAGPVKDNGRKLYVGTSITGTLDEIRLRKSSVSADWLKAEYDQATKDGFVTPGAGTYVGTSSISVISTSEPFGEVSPDYGSGRIRQPEDGQEYVFTCTKDVEMLEEGVSRAVCRGWKLYDAADGRLLRSSDDQGEERLVCRHTYVQDQGVTLAWQWEQEYFVSLTGDAGGQVTGGGWYVPGQTVTLTASPDEGYVFGFWTGDADSSWRLEPTGSFVMGASGRSLAAKFRKVVYVSTKGEATGTGSAEDPFKSVQKAINAAGPNGLVLIAPGTYGSSSSLVLTNGVWLVGRGEAKTDVVLELTASNDSAKNVLKIQKSSNSVVTNLTLTNGSRSDGSGVVMDSGLVTHCVIRDCKTYMNSVDGGGVNMSNGTVRFCDITNCDAYDTGGAGKAGGGVYMTGGVVEFCRIRDCKREAYGSAGRGGGVCIQYGGTLRNCLVSGCKTYVRGSGVCALSGTVESCTIVGNTQCSSAAGATGLYAEGTVLRNNIIWGNTKFDGKTAANVLCASLTAANVCNNDSSPAISVGSDNIAVDPLFVDAAHGDYHLGYSDCVDGGSDRTWMATATDLDGNPRIVGESVDIGCYERVRATGLECKFTVSTAKTFDAAAVTVVAEVDGDDTGLVYYWTFTRVSDNTVVKLVGDEYRESFTVDFPTGVWNAQLDVTNAALSSASSKVEKAMDVRASVAYVGKAGASVYPYASLETASASVDDAFAVLGEGGVLYVDEGDYTISSQLALASGKGSRIVSLKGPDKTSIRLANVAAFTGSGYRGISLEKASARLEGITVAGGQRGPQYSGSPYGTYGLVEIKADGAVMTNCVLRDAASASYGAGFNGMGLKISSGKASDCRIRNVSAYGSGGAQVEGSAIWMEGGIVDRFAISGCQTTGAGGTVVQGDIVYQKGGDLRNSLVTGCKTVKSVPVGVNGGGFYNCTVVCNTNSAAKTYAAGQTTGVNDRTAGVSVYAGTVKNCIIAKNWSMTDGCVTNLKGSVTYSLVDDRASLAGTGNKVGDPKFRRSAGREWRLKSTSPAINAGAPMSWMTETSVDLDGAPRIRNKIPDMGCYEGLLSGLVIFFN